jgi:hypothetical protein
MFTGDLTMVPASHPLPGNNRRSRTAARSLGALPADTILDLAVAALGRAQTRREICEIVEIVAAARLALAGKPSRYGQEGRVAA